MATITINGADGPGAATLAWFKVTDTGRILAGKTVDGTTDQEFVVELPETPLRAWLVIKAASASTVVTVNSTRKVQPGEAVDNETITFSGAQNKQFLIGKPYISSGNQVTGTVTGASADISLCYIF